MKTRSILMSSLLLSASLVGLNVASASDTGDTGQPKVSVNNPFDLLPTDIHARILHEASEGDLSKLEKFRKVSRNFKDAVERARQHLPVYLDVNMVTASNIDMLKHAKNLRLYLYTSQGDLSSEQWNAKLLLIGQLSNLKALSLNSENITDISALRGLTELVSLDLNYSKVSDISALKSMNHLESVDLSYTDVQSLEALMGKKGLKTLNLQGTKVTDNDLSSLRGLINLERLNLTATQITNLSLLPDMPKLEWLGVEGSDHEDFNSLKRFKKLKELFFRVNDELNFDKWDVEKKKIRAILPGVDVSYGGI